MWLLIQRSHCCFQKLSNFSKLFVRKILIFIQIYCRFVNRMSCMSISSEIETIDSYILCQFIKSNGVGGVVVVKLTQENSDVASLKYFYSPRGARSPGVQTFSSRFQRHCQTHKLTKRKSEENAEDSVDRNVKKQTQMRSRTKISDNKPEHRESGGRTVSHRHTNASLSHFHTHARGPRQPHISQSRIVSVHSWENRLGLFVCLLSSLFVCCASANGKPASWASLGG